MKNWFTIIVFFFYSLSYSQSINSNWKQELTNEFDQFRACENTAETGINPCNKFIGRSLRTVYKVNDFYAKELGRYMLVSEIEGFLKDSKRWTLLGHGYEQEALNKAQDYANAKKAVVAVYLNEENLGHLAIILPGALQPSGSWGFQVPNSAAYFMSEPEKSYMNKGLSYSFPRNLIKEVLIYGRNY